MSFHVDTEMPVLVVYKPNNGANADIPMKISGLIVPMLRYGKEFHGVIWCTKA